MKTGFKAGKQLMLVVALGIAPILANAADCEITTQRTACPGKEQEVLKPYGGKNPTVEIKAAASPEACKTLAEESSKIVRKGTLQGKTVSATYNKDSKQTSKFSDTSACS